MQSLRITDLSPKRNKKNLIGNKGLGFRAVLNWSRQPLILSGALSLTYTSRKYREIFELLKSTNPHVKQRIEEEQSRSDDIVLPALAFPAFVDNGDNRAIYNPCLELSSQGYDTVIGMPFDSRSSFENAINEVRLLKPEILLFTDNIEEVCLMLPDQPEIIWRREDQEGQTKSIEVSGDTSKNPSLPRRWRIFKKTERVPLEHIAEYDDSLQEYEIIIAVPDKKRDPFESMPLFSFFPTEVSFPYPVVCHATLELEANRKHPQDNRINRFILEEAAFFLATVAESQTDDKDQWCKAIIVARTKDVEALLVRLGFTRRLLEEANERKIMPTLAQDFMKPKHSRIVNAKDLTWLPPESFTDVVLPTEMEHLKTLIEELKIKELPETEFRERLNSIAFPDLDKRARLIAGLITNGVVPKDPAPDLLLDEADRTIKHSPRIYLPPAESGRRFDIPAWLNLRFVNNALRARLASYLGTTDPRELRQKLSAFQVNEYALANIASAMIAEVRRRIAVEAEKAKQYIQETLIALFLMYPENEDPPKLSETTGIPLPNKKGSFTDARALYFSAKYSSNGDLLEALYGATCPENLLASPEDFDLGFDGHDSVYNRFFKWLGVADLPRFILTDKAEKDFLNYVLDSLRYPFKMEDYFTSSRNDFGWYARLTKVRTIDNLDAILGSHPAAILTWLAVDTRASAWRRFDPENATLQDSRGNDRNYRTYDGPLPSYIHWKIRNSEWLPVTENRMAKPVFCMYGERSLEKIFPMPIDFSHALFEAYQIDRFQLRSAWDNAGVLPNISYLSPKQIVDILLQLPGIDHDGKSARVPYRNMLENIEVERHDWKGPVGVFRKDGQMWGKGPNGHKYYPVNALRHADSDDIPEQLLNQINVVDLPKRAGALKVQTIFGVEPIDRRKITVEVKNFIGSPRQSDIQHMFHKCKPYLFGLRQIKTKQYQEINAFKKLNLVLCRTIEINLTYETLNLEFSLAEPYQWILREDQAYILVARTNIHPSNQTSLWIVLGPYWLPSFG